MVQGDLLGPLLADIVGAASAGGSRGGIAGAGGSSGSSAGGSGGAALAGGGGRVILGVVVVAADVAGDGVDVVVVLGIVGVELHLILSPAVIPVQVGADEGDAGGGQAGVVQGDLLGPLLTDIAGAGRTGAGAEGGAAGAGAGGGGADVVDFGADGGHGGAHQGNCGDGDHTADQHILPSLVIRTHVHILLIGCLS